MVKGARVNLKIICYLLELRYYLKSAIFSKRNLSLLPCHCRVWGRRAESLLKLSWRTPAAIQRKDGGICSQWWEQQTHELRNHVFKHVKNNTHLLKPVISPLFFMSHLSLLASFYHQRRYHSPSLCPCTFSSLCWEGWVDSGKTLDAQIRIGQIWQSLRHTGPGTKSSGWFWSFCCPSPLPPNRIELFSGMP